MENFNIWSGEKISEKESHDNLDQLLNIDNLPKNGLHVKVVLKTSSGKLMSSWELSMISGLNVSRDKYVIKTCMQPLTLQ